MGSVPKWSKHVIKTENQLEKLAKNSSLLFLTLPFRGPCFLLCLAVVSNDDFLVVKSVLLFLVDLKYYFSLKEVRQSFSFFFFFFL